MPRVIDVFTENNDYQRFEVLKRNRNKRHKYNEFFVEGVRNINELMKSDWKIKNLLYSKHKPLSTWAKGFSVILEQHITMNYMVI